MRLFLLLVMLLVALPAWAEEKTVREIVVKGNHIVESTTILAQLWSEVGKPVDRKSIGNDVRRLFKTGFFADVKVSGEPVSGGIRLIYEVDENPQVSEVKIDGNDEIPEKKLLPKLKLKPGGIYSEANLTADRQMIRRDYLKKGYYQVEVTADAVKQESGLMAITLHVREGEITRIQRIRFIGNHDYDDKALRDVIASREATLSTFVTDRDIFEKQRLGADGQMLLQHYLNNGYLDARVDSTWTTLSEDKKWFFLTFNIFEGVSYKVSAIEVRGDLVPDRQTLFDLIKLKVGETYSLDKLQQSIEALTMRVGDEGFAFANVTPQFQRDAAARQVALVFEIEKGREVYVERINVDGNSKTEDQVIRREFRQNEGERFSSTKLERSKTRVKRLGYFEDVRVAMPRGETPDRVRLQMDVEEKRTGSFSLGAGYSQLEKVLFTAKVSESNLFGKGLASSLSAEIGGKTQNFDASLTEPYLLGHELGGTISAFKTQSKLQSYTAYQQNNIGGGLNLNLPFSDEFSASLGYRFTRTNIFNLPANATPILLSQKGIQTTGELSTGLGWDSRDSLITPSKGGNYQSSLSLAGVGGKNRFYEASLSAAHYVPLTEKITFNAGIDGRYIQGMRGQILPLYRRYSIGGVGSLRGFDYYGVSIRDANGDPTGGNKQITGTVNLYVPIPFIETKGFRGVFFGDGGTVADVNQPIGQAKLRYSAGFALQWISPVGPISLVWAAPLRKQPGDLTRSFEFAIGTVL